MSFHENLTWVKNGSRLSGVFDYSYVDEFSEDFEKEEYGVNSPYVYLTFNDRHLMEEIRSVYDSFSVEGMDMYILPSGCSKATILPNTSAEATNQNSFIYPAKIINDSNFVGATGTPKVFGDDFVTAKEKGSFSDTYDFRTAGIDLRNKVTFNLPWDKNAGVVSVSANFRCFGKTFPNGNENACNNLLTISGSLKKGSNKVGGQFSYAIPINFVSKRIHSDQVHLSGAIQGGIAPVYLTFYVKSGSNAAVDSIEFTVSFTQSGTLGNHVAVSSMDFEIRPIIPEMIE